ncbi:TRAP transporter substrate-binding protein [Xanthobacter agilis]|uniref:TRAP-type C4-dicarboxylate transport system substrate-binding protein n=1 Tax=Xanthobacter agilis TaxID=47492 RepID=A0ABU0LHX6_XANAG|nr:TRAP transporter substrate-binding protein DctP [Xanthobacter agilis]MDQ0506735.1 TRAP-type C4-dicarboxylate transport system substrate-binding protein [Xanthobacter agilis]
MTRRLRRSVPLAAAVFAAALVSAQAAEVSLKLADSLPAGHSITKKATQYFFDRAKTLSGGKVEFQHFPAEQLGKAKDLLTVTQTGLADIGYIVPSYVSEKMPLGAVAELPGGFNSSCEGAKAFWALAKPGGLLDTLEFKPNGVRVLYVVALSPYQAIFSEKAGFKSFEDFKGRKIRSNPGPMELALRDLGAVPIRMTPPEIFDAMTKGTIDGALLPYTSTFSYGLNAVVKSVTVGQNFGTVGITYSINASKWASLPRDVQEALTKAGDETVGHACAQFDQEEAELATRLKDTGTLMVTFTPEQEKVLEANFASVSKDWAQNLEKRGKPADKVLAAFRAAIAAQR